MLKSSLDICVYYHIFCESIECELSFLRNKRSIDDFKELFKPFILNFFNLNEDIINDAFVYIIQIQKEYFKELKKWQLVDNSLELSSLQDSDDYKRYIQNNNKVFTQINNNKNDTLSTLNKKKGINNKIKFNDEIFENYKSTFEILKDTMIEYTDLYLNADKYNCSIINNPSQIESEIMEYSSHFCSAITHYILEEKSAELNLTSANRHLRRAILDMLKGIILSLMHSYKNKIPKDKIKEILNMRQEEVKFHDNRDLNNLKKILNFTKEFKKEFFKIY